jgi:hypothetical protein
MILNKTLDEIAEEVLPYLASVALSIATYWYLLTEALPERTDHLIESSINVFAILVGFLGASLAIVLAIENKPVILGLKRDNKYKRFTRYFFEAAVWSFLALAASFILDGVKIQCTEKWCKNLVLGWFFLVVLASLVSMRVIWLLFRVLYKNADFVEPGAGK